MVPICAPSKVLLKACHGKEVMAKTEYVETNGQAKYLTRTSQRHC